MENITDKKIIKNIYKSLQDKFGVDITVINISEVSVLADYFIITSGNNPSQVQALADEVLENMTKEGLHPRKVEGHREGNWILLDFTLAIVHIFNQENREAYKLEKVWSSGTEINMEEF